MAHLLETLANGSASIAWTNEVPWHHLGVQMDNNATPTEFFIAAGLDTTVSKRPLFLQDGTPVPSSRLLCRDSDNTQYSIVGADWNPVQNMEIAEFLTRLFEAGDIKMETAGAVKNGALVWGLGKIQKSFDLPGGDEVHTNLLISSAHLYGKATTIRTTSTRVVCFNTLSAALSEKSEHVFRVNHRQDWTDKEIQNEAERVVLGATRDMDKFEEAARVLAATTVTQRQIEETIAEVYQPNLLTDESRVNKDHPLRIDFAALAESVLVAVECSPGATLKSAKGTAWGLLNAVTFVEDHQSMAKTRESALQSAWWGAGAARKQKALEACLRLAA
jgi:phage/plasmid-like protein (TIGR03299 family)